VSDGSHRDDNDLAINLLVPMHEQVFTRARQVPF
jgi:hypothetical protein